MSNEKAVLPCPRYSETVFVKLRVGRCLTGMERSQIEHRASFGFEIASRSPTITQKVGLLLGITEITAAICNGPCEVAHILRSVSLGRNREMRVSFADSTQNEGTSSLQARLHGGEGGIRTPGTLSGTPVFKTGAINHSATSPDNLVLLQMPLLGKRSASVTRYESCVLNFETHSWCEAFWPSIRLSSPHLRP
jgi:hypothetical protein